MTRVTLCFAGSDSPWADRISDWATQRGYEVDRLTDDGSGGDPVASHSHLLETDALLVILTSAWVTSPICRSIFREAQILRRPVFPVMIGKSGEFAIGSDCSRLNLSENEAVGLERLATAIDASSKAGLKARSAF